MSTTSPRTPSRPSARTRTPHTSDQFTISSSPDADAFPASPSPQFDTSLSDADPDLDLDDAHSISLSTPPRSPTRASHAGTRSGRPSSTLAHGIVSAAPGSGAEDILTGTSVSFFRDPDSARERGEVLWTASSDAALTSLGSASSRSRLLDSPSSPAPSGPLGPSLQLRSPPQDPTTSPRTPLSSRLSQIIAGTNTSPVATMPVPRPRPASLPLSYVRGELILAVVVIDFNHLVGPKVEFAVPPALAADEEMCNILPFLALPDGAHLNSEDYCYFHLCTAYTGVPQTVFGISCNRQIQTSQLLHKGADVTRSTVQKAVVVLASKPIFGPIRDKLGVVTRAYFNQLDFAQTDILVDFYASLEGSLSGQLTESALYMGTSLRELVHKFRHKTLTLLKMLMLQKKIMFFGQPVETLCTYQYSLISLIPGLLDQLQDCASPALDRRENDHERPSELRTSDRSSLLRYLGLPLNVFGKDAFFQPYLPLQEVDMLRDASGYLCGTTNNIVTQQRDGRPDLLVNVESNAFEFADQKVERSVVALTPADRKWMDEIVRSVQETWVEDDPSRPSGMQFLGSDDYLRAKFEDYICSALSCIKYADFLAKGARGDMLITGAPNPSDVVARFGEAFIGNFRQTRCGLLWDRTTDPVLFDICEPRHPCDNPPTLASDIGLRLTEGLHELNLEERMAPARDALNTAWTSGLRAVDGLQANIQAGLQSRWPSAQGPDLPGGSNPTTNANLTPRPGTGLRQLSLVRESFAPALQQGASVASEGAKGVAGVVGGWGSFIAGRVGQLAQQAQSPGTPTAAAGGAALAPAPAPVTPVAGAKSPSALRSFSFWERRSAENGSGSGTASASASASVNSPVTPRPGSSATPSLLSVASTSTRSSMDTTRDSGSGKGGGGAGGEGADGEGEGKPPNVSRGSSWSWLSRASSSSSTSAAQPQPEALVASPAEAREDEDAGRAV